MSLRQFNPSDTSRWNERYGSGASGAYSISSNTTENPVRTTITTTSGSTSSTFGNFAAGFTDGDLVLIHQSREGGDQVGFWELNKIASHVSNTVTLSYAATANFSNKAQVVKVSQYSSISVGSGSTLTSSSWDGNTGGIIAWLCSGTTTITGAVSAAGKGYVGGAAVDNGGGAGNTGRQGEGTAGAGQAFVSTGNGNGAGGGNVNNNPGAGGGNGAAGSVGSSGSATVGSSVGTTNLMLAEFGGGGGSGANNSGGGVSGSGGAGGGIIFIFSKAVTVTGSISANGNNGNVSSGSDGSPGAGGGGAGGSILIKSQSPVLGSSLVTSLGGSGGVGTGTTGGNGGSGRNRIEYGASLSGTTNPSASTLQDAMFLDTTNYVKADIRRTESQANSVKARVITSVTKNNSAKSKISAVRGMSVLANIDTSYANKKYFYRVYDGVNFVASWANEITTPVNYRVLINSGAGEVVVRLARSFDSFGEGVDIKLQNKVEIWCSDREAPNGQLIYSGYISGYRPIIQGTKEYLEVTIFPYYSEFARYMLRDGSGNTTIAFSSQDPANILKSIIDYYRLDGGKVNYTPASVDLTGTSVSYTFNSSTIKEALDTVITLCPYGWFWRVDPDNTIHLHARSAVATHTFRLKKNITALETWRRIDSLVNRVYFTGAGTPALYKKYENTSSIATYGLYAVKLVDQRVTNSSTAQIMSQRLIDDKKDPEIRTKITILDSNGDNSSLGYDLESIKVGDTMKILGLKDQTKTVSLWDQSSWDQDVWDQTLTASAADVIQILSVTYKEDTIELEASSRLPEVQKRIEDINNNLVDSQTIANPTIPT